MKPLIRTRHADGGNVDRRALLTRERGGRKAAVRREVETALGELAADEADLMASAFSFYDTDDSSDVEEEMWAEADPEPSQYDDPYYDRGPWFHDEWLDGVDDGPSTVDFDFDARRARYDEFVAIDLRSDFLPESRPLNEDTTA